jgi:hypothetical protein
MALIELTLKVDRQYELWIQVSKKTLADSDVDCEEARRWLGWYQDRKKDISLLKREIQLEMRGIRGDFKVKIASATIWGEKTKIRNEQTIALAPYEELMAKLERLLVEGDKLQPTLEQFVAKDCQDK